MPAEISYVAFLSGVGHSFTNPDLDALDIPGFRYGARAERRAWTAMKTLFAEAFGLVSSFAH